MGKWSEVTGRKGKSSLSLSLSFLIDLYHLNGVADLSRLMREQQLSSTVNRASKLRSICSSSDHSNMKTVQRTSQADRLT